MVAGIVTGVHVIVPDDVDDPQRPSGGNVYDRRVCRELATIGWSVHEHLAPGRWPWVDAAERAGLAGMLSGIPRGGLVLLDGLVAAAAPELLVRFGDRLRLVLLMHMSVAELAAPDGSREMHAAERESLDAAAAVVTTSRWTGRRLNQLYALPADRIHVVEPGVDIADVAPGTAAGGELLCVAAVTPAKGHDVLVAALAMVRELSWRCVCVGSLGRDPDFVDRLRRQATSLGLADQIHFTGPLTGDDLRDAYATADLLVLPSRTEAYGMVITEALARGLPVVASGVGGVPEALGRSTDGTRPGVLVRSGDAQALAGALRRWLQDVGGRRRLRSAALGRRATLSGWWQTAHQMSQVLTKAAG